MAISIKQARADLTEATASRDSQLCRWAPSIFSGERLDLFMASYMAMRRIDDQIDDLPVHDRHDTSPALAWIDDWQDKVHQASLGEPTGENGADRAIWRLLAARLPDADFDSRPFRALAGAMRHDAQGRDMKDWGGFLHYCEGATVAPTAIYLALMQDEHKSVRFEEIWEWARPLAIFCYLSHILRDLRKDARAGGHLLTIPKDIFADLASCRRELARGLIDDDGLKAMLSRRLIGQVRPILEALEKILSPVTMVLTGPANLVLAHLLDHYGKVMEEAAHKSGCHEFAIPHFISGTPRPI